MAESAKEIIHLSEEANNACVYVLLKQRVFILSGTLEGAPVSSTFFCCDTLRSLLKDNEYSIEERCLIHPDDIELLYNAIQKDESERISNLVFRVITLNEAVVQLHMREVSVASKPNASFLSHVKGNINNEKEQVDGTQQKKEDKDVNDTEWQKSAEWMQVMINALPQIAWTALPDGNINFYNNRWFEHTGLSIEESLNSGWINAMHPDFQQPALERWATCVQTGEVYELEHLLKHQNGGYRWQLARAVPLKDKQGKITLWVGTCTDIHEQKTTESQLKESRHFIELLADAMHDILYVFDINEKKIVYINHEVKNVLGYTEQEIYDLGAGVVPSLLKEEDLEVYRNQEELFHYQQGNNVKELEFRVKNKAGEWKWFKARFTLFKKEGGEEAAQVVGIAQDISKDVLLRKELAERAHFIERLIDSSVDRIYVLNTDLNVIEWNRKCEEYYKVGKEKIIGRSLFDVFPRLTENSLIMGALQQALKGEQVHLPPAPEVYINAITERFYIPLKNEEAEVTGILCILHDVTKFHRAKEELKELNKSLEAKNVELESKNEEITSFAFVASHDLKEPLRKVHTFSDWLQINEKEHLSPRGRDYIERISQTVRRLSLLIDDVMTITQIHSSRTTLENIDLKKVLSRVLDEMKDLIESSGAVIEAEELPIVRGIQTQLGYLFQNIISNGIKFQSPGNQPEIHISTEIIDNHEHTIENLPEGEFVKVCFTDNGIGFEDRYAKKIFQMFQRLHGQNQFSGTGMGLAICKKIMENHNGFITVRSEINKGSEFCCYFPI